jgi:hypothetical protein
MISDPLTRFLLAVSALGGMLLLIGFTIKADRAIAARKATPTPKNIEAEVRAAIRFIGWGALEVSIIIILGLN